MRTIRVSGRTVVVLAIATVPIVGPAIDPSTPVILIVRPRRRIVPVIRTMISSLLAAVPIVVARRRMIPIIAARRDVIPIAPDDATRVTAARSLRRVRTRRRIVTAVPGRRTGAAAMAAPAVAAVVRASPVRMTTLRKGGRADEHQNRDCRERTRSNFLISLTITSGSWNHRVRASQQRTKTSMTAASTVVAPVTMSATVTATAVNNASGRRTAWRVDGKVPGIADCPGRTLRTRRCRRWRRLIALDGCNDLLDRLARNSGFRHVRDVGRRQLEPKRVFTDEVDELSLTHFAFQSRIRSEDEATSRNA